MVKYGVTRACVHGEYQERVLSKTLRCYCIMESDLSFLKCVIFSPRRLSEELSPTDAICVCEWNVGVSSLVT